MGVGQWKNSNADDLLFLLLRVVGVVVNTTVQLGTLYGFSYQACKYTNTHYTLVFYLRQILIPVNTHSVHVKPDTEAQPFAEHYINSGVCDNTQNVHKDKQIAQNSNTVMYGARKYKYTVEPNIER